MMKKELRQTLCQKRKKLTDGYRHQAAQQVYRQIVSLQIYQSAKKIALYRAQHGEIDLNDVWSNALESNKTCYFPVMQQDKTLFFCEANLETKFIKNRFGLLEPVFDIDKAVAINTLDIIIAPLVAFDLNGNRLGMGGGYYDRTLAHQRPKILLGAAYEFQRQALLINEPWDIKLDIIVTEKAIYWVSK